MGNYSPVRKSDDFSGANEGKIERVKEEHQIFSLVILVHKRRGNLESILIDHRVGHWKVVGHWSLCTLTKCLQLSKKCNDIHKVSWPSDKILIGSHTPSPSHLQRDVFEFAVNHGGSFEVRGGFSDERLSHFDRWSKINIRVEIWNIQIKFYTKQSVKSW